MPDSVKLILVLLILGLTAHLMAQDTPAGFETSGPAIGIFSGHLDVGAPSIAGDATYDTETNHTTLMADGLSALLAGERPSNLANPEVLTQG